MIKIFLNGSKFILIDKKCFDIMQKESNKMKIHFIELHIYFD